MKHTIAELKDKIHQMYPDIDKYGITSSLTYDKGKKTYVLELKKDSQHLATYIDKEDGDEVDQAFGHGRAFNRLGHSGARVSANPESRDSWFDASHRPGMTRAWLFGSCFTSLFRPAIVC